MKVVNPPFRLPAPEKLQRLRSAIMRTNRGEIYLELFPEDAPWHVANFKFLADRGFYNNLPFHIFERGHLIQGGAPGGDIRRGPAYSLPPEFNDRKHSLGTLGMARRPDHVNYQRRSHGSQFHIILGDAPHMDGNYTAFGRVTRGLDVLDDLKKGDYIIELRVYVRS
jgi:cyclophilin family peptidyl-prolyl cis-trans isomerase